MNASRDLRARPCTLSMPQKRINKSKLHRKLRPPAIDFEMTFIAVGAGCGMLGALVFEALTRPRAVYMLFGAFVGTALGGVIEMARFWWRKHKQGRSSNRE